jgi:hypothetical protein
MPDDASRLSPEERSLEYHKARQLALQGYNAEMSKWIPRFAHRSERRAVRLPLEGEPDALNLLKPVAAWFVVGLALAVLCGFLAWLNTGMREADAGYTIRRLLDPTDPPNPQARR